MPDTNLIRILLVDDHDIVRKGISVFLQTCEDFVLVGEAATGIEAIEQCKLTQPDVILMDLVMPEQGGITTIRQISKSHPTVKIIALTSYSDDHQVQDALQAGAIGFLHKNVSIDALASAIRSAHMGQPTLSPEATSAVIRTANKPESLGAELTKREEEVLKLLVEGYNNTKIAETLVIGRATVKTHVSNILAKLDVENRQEAISKALRTKMVE